MENNYFQYWYQRIIKDGLKAIKLIIGIGIAFGVSSSGNLPLAAMVFGYVLADALIDKN
jgi:hypothetical protein